MQPVIYLDEEECLGIDAFVNELELLCHTGRQAGRVDQAQLLELLPKLAATIPKTSENKSMLKSMQKRCERVFTELINLGVCSTVRRLVCLCLTRFYMHGDMLSIYARVSALQSTLSGKDPGQNSKPITDVVRMCMMEVLAYLALHHGRYLASAAAENVAIASKSLSKFGVPVRVAALHLAASTVEGMNSADRGALAVQAEAWTLFLKAARERTCVETRAAGAQLLSAMARSGGVALWRDGGYFWEEALRVCIASLTDTSQAVRDGYAMALCDLAVAVRLDTLGSTIKDTTRPGNKAQLERLRADNGVAACRAALHQPLVDFALLAKGDVCASLALAWCSYIGFVAAHSAGNANILVDMAVQVVGLCDSASRSLSEAKAQGLVADASLGGALAGGELPHLQACVLYILRAAVVEGLSEAGQRLLLQRLAALLQRPSCPVPTAVVALEGMAILLDVLGEISDETGASAVEAAIITQVGSSSTPARQLASQAAAALAAAQPANAAALLGSMLDKLEASAMLLGGVRPGLVVNSVTAAYDTLLGKTQPVLMATAHGAALAAASVIMVAMRLPLSVPSALPRQAYDIAVRLIMEPHSEGAASRALEREAGYIVLGALISCWGARTLSVSATLGAGGAGAGAAGVAAHSPQEALGQVMGCLALALGEEARAELDENIYTHPGGETELAMELWWRSVALQALRTCMTALLTSGLVEDPAHQVTHIADLLAPVLAMVDSQVCMQDPHKSKGGPAGLLAACSATFQLRLLECVQLLDLTRLQPASQSILLKMCSKPVRAAGMAAAGVGAGLAAAGAPPSAVAASVGYNAGVSAALHRTALHYCLAKEDATLGPWPAGRFTAEDELHDFAGERGAPHNQPWEAPLLAALFRNVDPTADNGGGNDGVGAARGRGGTDGEGRGAVSTDRARGSLYPQPIGLAPGLLAAQAAVLGRLLCLQSQSVQLQILEDMISAASAGKSRKPAAGDRESGARKHAAGTLVAVAALSGLVPLTRRAAHARAAADLTAKVADKVLLLANALMDGGGAAEAGIARAGAQLLACSACIGTDSWAVKVVHAIVDEVSRSVAEGRDSDRRAALCLALGCIHRSKGGLALQAVVPATVGALLAAVKRPVGHAALWSLHALSLCAGSAGAAYMPHVKVTLQLCQDLMVSGYDVPGLRPACARLANCMVGVLGPEFTLGSANYSMAKSLTSDLVHVGVLAVDDTHAVMQAATAGAGGGGGGGSGGPGGGAEVAAGAPRLISIEALSCELQAVLFAQQAILFAPSAVQAGKHVPMLQATLLSPRPALRKAAAATLFHLSKRDPRLLLPAQIEGALFAALDGETNASIAGLLRESLRILTAEGARTLPSYWLACLSEVVFSSAGGAGGLTPGAAGDAGAGARNGGAPGRDEEDDEDGEGDGGRPGAAAGVGRSPGGGMSKPQSTQNIAAGGAAGAGASGSPHMTGATGGPLARPQALQAVLATVALRLRTRLFAAELLLRMVRMAGEGKGAGGGEEEGRGAGEEASPGAAREDRLVDHLQELVDVGFKLSTGGTEALRPAGVQLLDAILHTFADVEDPLLPGACLLEQYQAQLVSALRAALSPSAAPQLAVVGGRLATTFLESGLVAGDGQVMSRLMDLLTGPLAVWGTQPHAGAYAEWVDVHQRVALLRAHAHCATLARHGGDDLAASIVSKAHKPFRPLLASLWAALLQDHAIVSSQHPIVRQAYRSALLMAAAPATTRHDDITQPTSGPSSALTSPRMSLDGKHHRPSGLEGQLGVMSSDMVAHVRGVYASACPVVLEAVTSHFPSATEVHASRAAVTAVGPSVTSLWSRYTNLLDVGVMLVLDSSKALAAEVEVLTNSVGNGNNPSSSGWRGSGDGGAPQALTAHVSRLLACVQGLRKLLDAEYVAAGLAAVAVVAGVLRALTGMVQSVLLPLAWLALRAPGGAAATHSAHLATLATAVSDLIKELAQGVGAGQFAAAAVNSSGGAAAANGSAVGASRAAQQPALAPALLEAILAASSVTTPFSLITPAPQPPRLMATSPTMGRQAAAQRGGFPPSAAASAGGAEAPARGGGGVVYASRTPPSAAASAGGAEAPAKGAGGVVYASSSLVLPPSVQGALDSSEVSLLVAATLLLRKAPPGDLQMALPALLQLTSRLLHTAPPGMQLQATHRFMGTLLTTVTTTAARLTTDTETATPSSTPATSAGGAAPPNSKTPFSPLPTQPAGQALMTAAWLTLADLAQQVQAHVTELTTLAAGGAAARDAGRVCSEVESARCGACMTALMSAAWHLKDASAPPTSPANLPSIVTSLIWQAVSSAISLAAADTDDDVHDSTGDDGNGNVAASAVNGVMAVAGSEQLQAEQALARVRRLAVEAVRVAVQEGSGAQGPQGSWCKEALLVLCPLVASTTHQLLTQPASGLASSRQQPSRQPSAATPTSSTATENDRESDIGGVTPAGSQAQVAAVVSVMSVGEEIALGVCEGIKALVAAASLASAQGPAQAQAVCWVLLTLMVEAAAPSPEAAALLGPAPRDLALKLLTSLPASPLGDPFRTAISSLAAESKARLQAALQASVTAAAATAAASDQDAANAAGAGQAKPTIQLKTSFNI